MAALADAGCERNQGALEREWNAGDACVSFYPAHGAVQTLPLCVIGLGAYGERFVRAARAELRRAFDVPRVSFCLPGRGDLCLDTAIARHAHEPEALQIWIVADLRAPESEVLPSIAQAARNAARTYRRDLPARMMCLAVMPDGDCDKRAWNTLCALEGLMHETDLPPHDTPDSGAVMDACLFETADAGTDEDGALERRAALWARLILLLCTVEGELLPKRNTSTLPAACRYLFVRAALARLPEDAILRAENAILAREINRLRERAPDERVVQDLIGSESERAMNALFSGLSLPNPRGYSIARIRQNPRVAPHDVDADPEASAMHGVLERLAKKTAAPDELIARECALFKTRLHVCLLDDAYGAFLLETLLKPKQTGGVSARLDALARAALKTEKASRGALYHAVEQAEMLQKQIIAAKTPPQPIDKLAKDYYALCETINRHRVDVYRARALARLWKAFAEVAAAVLRDMAAPAAAWIRSLPTEPDAIMPLDALEWGKRKNRTVPVSMTSRSVPFSAEDILCGALNEFRPQTGHMPSETMRSTIVETAVTLKPSVRRAMEALAVPGEGDCAITRALLMSALPDGHEPGTPAQCVSRFLGAFFKPIHELNPMQMAAGFAKNGALRSCDEAGFEQVLLSACCGADDLYDLNDPNHSAVRVTLSCRGGARQGSLHAGRTDVAASVCLYPYRPLLACLPVQMLALPSNSAPCPVPFVIRSMFNTARSLAERELISSIQWLYALDTLYLIHTADGVCLIVKRLKASAIKTLGDCVRGTASADISALRRDREKRMVLLSERVARQYQRLLYDCLMDEAYHELSVDVLLCKPALIRRLMGEETLLAKAASALAQREHDTLPRARG